MTPFPGRTQRVFEADATSLFVAGAAGAAITFMGLAVDGPWIWPSYLFRILGVSLTCWSWGSWKFTRVALDDEKISMFNWTGRLLFSFRLEDLRSVEIRSVSTGGSEIVLSNGLRSAMLPRLLADNSGLCKAVETQMALLNATESSQREGTFNVRRLSLP